MRHLDQIDIEIKRVLIEGGGLDFERHLPAYTR
jgi:hypothetical protein